MVRVEPGRAQPCARRGGWAGLLLALALAACGGGGSEGTVGALTMAKATGALRCGASLSTQSQLQTELDALKKAGVNVTASACGQSHQASASTCGSPTGEVWLIEVTSATASSAMAQGYLNTEWFGGVDRVDCADR